MTLVVAQGTFDLLHPGHIHYLEEAGSMGDELVVIIARRQNVTHKPAPIIPARQRRDIVDALAVVDRAILGNEDDIFVPIERLDPDIIVLGYDQHHEERSLANTLADRGVDCEVRRASQQEPRYEGALLSTGSIVERILAERG